MDKKSYAFGMSLAGNLLQNGVHGLNFDDFVAGLKAMLQGDKLAISMEEAGEALEQFYKEMEEEASERAAAAGAAAKEEGEKFLAANAKKEGVKTLESGVQYKVLKEGTGIVPADTSLVKVHYEGRLLNDSVFDSSYKRGEPITLRCNQTIKGWTDAMTHMPAGSIWEVYIPQDLAYGEREQGMIKPFSVLKFKIELIEVNPKK